MQLEPVLFTALRPQPTASFPARLHGRGVDHSGWWIWRGRPCLAVTMLQWLVLDCTLVWTGNPEPYSAANRAQSCCQALLSYLPNFSARFPENSSLCPQSNKKNERGTITEKRGQARPAFVRPPVPATRGWKTPIAGLTLRSCHHDRAQQPTRLRKRRHTDRQSP